MEEEISSKTDSGSSHRETSLVIDRTNDPYYLCNSNHPVMLLVTVPLNGSNYLSSSRSMKIAFRAKDKLSFINGKCFYPDINSPSFEKWQRVDSMVLS